MASAMALDAAAAVPGDWRERIGGAGMVIVQISDMHMMADGAWVHGIVDTTDAVRRIVDAVNALEPPPDVVLVTGDVTHDGDLPAADCAYAALARLRAPAWVIAGNHDDRDVLRAAFGRYSGDLTEAWLAYAVEDFGLRLLALDVSTDDPYRGEIAAAQIDWLAARLAEAPERPTLLLMHQPPFDTGVDWLDGMWLAAGRHEFGAVLRRHANVVAVLSGHLHRSMRGDWYGVPVIAAPSVMDRVTFTGWKAPGEPELAITAPPGFLLHRWNGAELCTELHFLDGHVEGWESARPDPAAEILGNLTRD